MYLPFYIKLCMGCFSVILGVTLLLLKSWILDFVAASILLLEENSLIENIWLKPPAIVPTDVYVFNWTNPEDFHNSSTKPKLQQLGPYRYLQQMEKRNVVWNDNNTVTFNQVRYWHFDEEHTNGNLSDKVTIINAFAMCFAHYARDWNYFIKRAVSTFLTSSHDLHFTKIAREFLNDGFEDPLLDWGQYFPFIASHIPRFEKFGLLYIRNSSETFDGIFNMANGINGNFDLLNWNYYNITPYFDSACAKVRGSAGELYSRTNTKDYIEIFLSDLCRPLRFDFKEEVAVDGIAGYKYVIGDNVLDNGTLVPGNECYCAGDCIPSGMINSSSCRWGLPVFVSLPNFYGADPVYLDAVEGLHPDKSKHESYIVLEPTTNILLKAAARFQVNVLVHPIEDISLFEDVPKIFFPIVWGEQAAVLPKELRVYLKIFLVVPNVIIGVAVILITLGFYVLIRLTFGSKPTILYKTITSKKNSLSMSPEGVPLQQNFNADKSQIVTMTNK